MADRAREDREYEAWQAEWNHPWREWRDLFQTLSFNSWMMVPALLFIEKPYHRNLLKRDKTSPFRRRHWTISTIYLILMLKKFFVIYANTSALADGCLEASSTGLGYSRTVAILALVATSIHGVVWFFTAAGQFMGLCVDEHDDDEDPDAPTLMDTESESSSDEEDGRRSSVVRRPPPQAGQELRASQARLDMEPELEPEAEAPPAARVSQPMVGVSRTVSPRASKDFSAAESDDEQDPVDLLRSRNKSSKAVVVGVSRSEGGGHGGGAASGARDPPPAPHVQISGLTAELQVSRRVSLPQGLAGTTVWELKGMFYQQIESFPMDQMNLQLSGQPVMDNTETLAAAGVAHEATLILSRMIKGGGGAEGGASTVRRGLGARVAAFAPSSIPQKKRFRLDIHMYVPELEETIAQQELDEGLEHAITPSKVPALRVSTAVQVTLILPDDVFEVEDGGVVRFEWDGESGRAQFAAKCLPDADVDTHPCKAKIEPEGEAFHMLRFDLVVVETSPLNSRTPSPPKLLSATLDDSVQDSWDCMISYVQRNGNSEALALAMHGELISQGKRVWLDVKMKSRDEVAMEDGVKNSRIMIAIVSGPMAGQPGTGYFQREWCKKELDWAREVGVVIQPVVTMEDKPRITELMTGTGHDDGIPVQLQDLTGVNWEPVERKDA